MILLEMGYLLTGTDMCDYITHVWILILTPLRAINKTLIADSKLHTCVIWHDLDSSLEMLIEGR